MVRTLIGTRIREKRRVLKLTQSRLAALAGISAPYLNLIEHNKRGIAGKTLLSIADALNLSPSDLAQEADQHVIGSIREAAAGFPEANAEVDRTEEFIGRFPGFSKLLTQLSEQSSQQSETLFALSDRLNNDPFFAEAMHLMLSQITAIRSSADILQNDPELPVPLREKFLGNLSTESKRMSDTVQDMIDHFAPAFDPEDHSRTTDPVDAYFQRHQYFIAAMEEQGRDQMTASDGEENPAVERAINSYKSMASTLPIDQFLKDAHVANFDVLALAEAYGIQLEMIFRRLAHMPQSESHPEFGLLEIDGSGAVLFRKQIPSLSLPQHGAACPMWPIYRCMSSPNNPTQMFIDMPTGERFLAISIAYPTEASKLGIPGLTKASMLVTADHQKLLSKGQASGIPKLAVGTNCVVCPRSNCKARRTDYFLG